MQRVAVATSGGRDSTALLHCTLRQAQPLGLQVLALHVHHGLMPQADAWQAQVRAQARRWGAGFDTRCLQGQPAAGESVEAWARRGRYAALAEMARAGGASIVLLAHHRRDQAETWLLQALRGGGPAGLAAMPVVARREGITWARPWLDQPRALIQAYVRRHRLRVVEDPSNADPRFARSRLRQQLWPALLGAFPDAEAALAASSRRAAEAAALAQECAAEDLARCQAAAGLDIAAWLGLPRARRLNALRTWLAAACPAPCPQSLVDRLMGALAAAGSARHPAPGGELLQHRGLLRFQATEAAALPQAVAAPMSLRLDRPGLHALPGWPQGLLQVQACSEAGLPAAQLRQVQVLPRKGGERWQARTGAPPRSLKLQYQAAGVPAWERGGPLLANAAGELLWVPGLGVDARQQAQPGQPQLALRWLPGAGAPGGRGSVSS